MDPIGAYNAAAAIVTALHHRSVTGAGQYVEVPQIEAAMQFIGAELLSAAADGADPVRQGNHVGWAAPDDVYPAMETTNGSPLPSPTTACAGFAHGRCWSSPG